MNRNPEPIPLREADLCLPRRAAESHKGDYGRLLILGGSVGYTGAPSLCARAAVRAGAGLVYLGVPAPIYTITAVKNDEAMPFPLPGTEAGQLSLEAVGPALEKLAGCDVCAVGPGLGRGPGSAALLRGLLAAPPRTPLVIDADGLNALAEDLSPLDAWGGTAVLTPHPGEFRRLGGEVSGDRAEDARRFAREHRCVLVLKGRRTVVAFPDGTACVCPRGNPGMAKGGSGDVLTGILGALLCQIPDPRRAVLTGVYLHSLAGDLCRDRLGEYSMTASDLIETLPEATTRMLEDEQAL